MTVVTVREIRCASCSAELGFGADGLLVGCEHTGKRNLSLDELRVRRLGYNTPATPEPTAHPAPEVRGQVVGIGDLPGGAAPFAKAAIGAGWVVEATYARGFALGSLRKTESWLLRCSRGSQRAVAVWEAPEGQRAKSDGAWLLTPVFVKLGPTQLRAYLAAKLSDEDVAAIAATRLAL